MGKYYWINITRDRYELPIAVGDTAEELAKMVGCTKSTVVSAVCRNRKIKNPVFLKISKSKEDLGGDEVFSMAEERNKLGLTQREMAEKLGLSIGGYCNIEKGRYMPCIATAKKIAEILKMDWRDIYE